jgi:diguanylate cyclase (GGDEF)-like protein
MPKFKPALSPNEPDPALLDLMDLFERICLTAVEGVALLSSIAWLITGLGNLLQSSGDLMNPSDALCALAASVSFQLSSPRSGRRSRRIAFIFACFVTALATSICVAQFIQIYLVQRTVSVVATHPIQAHFMGIFVALAFALLGVGMALTQSRRRFASRVADILLSLLGFLVLVFVYAHLFRFIEGPRPLSNSATAPETIFCIALLSLIALLREAPTGIFAAFFGRGIAGRIARFTAPILLFFPFLREGSRIVFLGVSRVPASVFSAILASLASLLSIALLLYIARRISKMESEIHELSFRDELTGLSNLRGFRLLGEQALRMARRSHAPFSLLFIDLDRLKEINDSYGHTIGSNILSDTGKILMATFRESDVLGRVGGDEFAVAGQFSQAAITVAIHRLREAIAQRNARHAQEPLLSLSLGHVTCEPDGAETLDDLLEKADFSMYEEKRLKQSRTA